MSTSSSHDARGTEPGTTTRAVWFLPFRRVVPADLELWFEQRAAEGWQPARLGQWSSLRTRLRSTPAATVRYVVDMQTRPRADYLATYEDFGWEHVGQMASMHVWRMPYEGERPEAFTEPSSRRARTVKVAAAAATAGALLLVGGVVELVVSLATGDDGVDVLAGAAIGLMGLAVCWAALTIWRHREQAG